MWKLYIENSNILGFPVRRFCKYFITKFLFPLIQIKIYLRSNMEMIYKRLLLCYDLSVNPNNCFCGLYGNHESLISKWYRVLTDLIKGKKFH